MVSLEALKHGHFLPARRAPGRPKIEENNIATIVGERAGRFVSNELELEIGGDFVRIVEDRF